jgi:hypothetical protein
MAALFVVLAAVILLRGTGSEWLERFFFTSGAVTGATAYAMSIHAVGGWVERFAVLVFNPWFLLSLGRAYWLCLRGEAARRPWMTRAVAVLLGIATTRPVMGVFFATSTRTHLGSNQFFGIAFWVGPINAVIIELGCTRNDGRNSEDRVPALLLQYEKHELIATRKTGGTLISSALIVERVKAGLRNARAKGKKLVRPNKVMDATRIVKLRAQGRSWCATATQLDVGLATLHRQSVPRSKIQERDFGTQ